MGREVLSLDSGWLFRLGDIESPIPNRHIAAYMANKAGWARGPAKPDYDDSDWRSVDLPHDWSVEGEFHSDNHLDAGFLPRGVGWYRRHFQLDEADKGNYLALQFDGVATHAAVYVNGHLLHRNFCGYTPFTIDISDVAKFGEQLNVIAVRVDATYMEGWWYEGAGIYRHVWLIKAHPIHVAPDGVFVHAARTDSNKWSTRVETTVHNTSDARAECEITTEIIEWGDYPRGETVLARAGSALSLAPREQRMPCHLLEVSNPTLWSLDEPEMYDVVTSIVIAGQVVDGCAVAFGYRTIRFDPEHGFFLNDRPVKLKGTCNHQDHAGVGVAVPDSIHEFRIRRLKEMGCNAIRCAHNPPAPELLDACDRLGMLVMDENRNFGSSPQHLEQLRAMVLRDRNHPSVILWSICNEEAIQGTPVAANIARAMQAEVKELDPTRPVTAAVSGGILNDDSMADVVEVMGINYQLPANDAYHAKHPATPLLAAETHSTFSTRGTYETDPARFVFASYDDDKAPWGEHARDTWRFVRDRPYVAGLFAWTGFDYRGEPTPHEWPCVNSHFGILDTCGFAKDAFFLHKAWWTDAGVLPFVHVLPNWNWTDREGQPVRVMTYTNCEEVEVFLNGESLGRKSVDPIEMAQWAVDYRPGTLKAVAFRGGAIAAETTVQTTGPPVALGLEVHPSADLLVGIRADGHFAVPITVFASDADGRRVPTADNFITFSLTGEGKILGVGNGDPTCHEPDKGTSRSLFRGLAQVILQTTTTPGLIALMASSPNLRPAALELTSKPAPPWRPSLPPAAVRYFVTGWRMSPITSDRPDPNQQIAEQDMNSWERVDPARPQVQWESQKGYAIYRATLKPPRLVQARGGELVFPLVAGVAEVYVDGERRAAKENADPGGIIIALPAVAASPVVSVVSVLIRADSPRAGLHWPVEIVPK